jgi:hypothetical protein
VWSFTLKRERNVREERRNSVKRILAVAVGLAIYVLIAYSHASEKQMTIKIHIKANGRTTEFELNNSPAAQDLYAQLPLRIKVGNYSINEKIFYPPKKLNTADTPKANAKAGTLAYYAPWGDVVMFYGSFGSAPGLYELGHAVSGSDYIQGMTGTLEIEKDDTR